MSKSAARASNRIVRQHAPAAPRRGLLGYAVAAAAVLIAFWVYSPALHGPFLFDDTVLPFALPGFAQSGRR